MTKPKESQMAKRSQPDVSRRAPHDSEAAAISAAKDRVKSLPVRPEPQIAVGANKVVTVTAPHTDENGNSYMMMSALGTASNPFVSEQLRQILLMTSSTQGVAASTDEAGSAFALIAALAPENELEAALAVQMAGTHAFACDMLGRAKHATSRAVVAEYGNLATKAQRTFVAQVEALTKLRTGGKQIVEHRHIYIDNRGGQAVVAENMISGGTGNGSSRASQSHALSPALLGADAAGHGMPGPPHQGPEAVPNARRPSRRAQG